MWAFTCVWSAQTSTHKTVIIGRSEQTPPEPCSSSLRIAPESVHKVWGGMRLSE